jgi:hypothetical protein
MGRREPRPLELRPLGGLPTSQPLPLKEESFLIPVIVTVRNDKVLAATEAHSRMLDVLVDLRNKGKIVRFQTSVTQVINRGNDVE